MKDFQRALEECLKRISNDTAGVDECLARYPEHAEELKPLLQTVFLLRRGRNLTPSATFTAFTRSALIQTIQFRPRRVRNLIPVLQRTALTFAIFVVAFLVTGTVHAQSVLPGDNFYPWKRSSEKVWETLSLDPEATHIAITNRRMAEWIAVADDPKLNVSAMSGYLEALVKLQSEGNKESFASILPVLQSQHRVLNNAGLDTPQLDSFLAVAIESLSSQGISDGTFTATATATVTLTKFIPSVTSTDLPTARPTDLPTATPTDLPTATPTDLPTATPTDLPTATPTDPPAATPTDPPAATLTYTDVPEPTPMATDVPEFEPTFEFEFQ